MLFSGATPAATTVQPGMRPSRFARFCNSAMVALLLCLLLATDRVTGVIGLLPLAALFVLFTVLLHLGSGRLKRPMRRKRLSQRRAA